ncbi:MAG: succinate dehydrogenase, hydrophobic membrane anchor protein [Burkholderiaceae bacterium]
MRQLSGQRAWLLQRVSALMLLLAALAFVLFALLAPRPDWRAWQAFVAHPLGASCLVGFALAIAIHAWVGVRDILLDYVHRTGLRLALLAAVAGIIIFTLLWVLLIVARVSLAPL